MLIISLLLSAFVFLVSRLTKNFCLLTGGFFALSFAGTSLALAQGVPTLAPPDPSDLVLDNEQQDAISAPPLLAPMKLSPSDSKRSNEETLPPPSTSGRYSIETKQTNETKQSGGPPLRASNEIQIKREWTLPRDQHPWARFSRGAWRTFRVESETFDETGISLGRSTTIRTESLDYVGANRYDLRISTMVDVGGKRLNGTPQSVALDLLTDGLISPNRIDKQGSTSISLHGQAVPCTIWDLVTALDRGERHELVYYSAAEAPHVLRRERIDTIDGQVVGQKTTNIIRDGLPVMVGRSLQPGRHLLVTEQFASGGRRECFEIHSDRIPGGLVESTEIDYGPTGQRVRWATTELIGAGLQQGVPLIAPRETPLPRVQAPQLQIPQLERPLGSPFPWRGNRRGPMEDRDSDDRNDEDRDDDDRDDDDEDRRRRREDDREDDDEENEEDDKPRRLLRLLRRAEAYFPAETEPAG